MLHPVAQTTKFEKKRNRNGESNRLRPLTNITPSGYKAKLAHDNNNREAYNNRETYNRDAYNNNNREAFRISKRFTTERKTHNARLS